VLEGWCRRLDADISRLGPRLEEARREGWRACIRAAHAEADERLERFDDALRQFLAAEGHLLAEGLGLKEAISGERPAWMRAVA
jgi:hypothetical protein